MNVEKDERGLQACCACSTARPPRSAGIQQAATSSSAVNGRSIAGREQRGRDQPHQGPGRHHGRRSRCFTPGRSDDRTVKVSASASRCRWRAGRIVERGRPQDRRRASCSASARAPTALLRREVDKLLRPGRRGDRARPARQRRRPAVRGGARVEHLHRGRQDRLRARARTAPERTQDAEGDAIDEDIPVVVLVDGGSASASEIVTGALRDRDRATVVGTRTFGKGLVQEVEPLSNGGVLDLTVANYYLPGGETISTNGHQAAGQGRGRARTPSATRRCPWRWTTLLGKLDERRRPRPPGPAARPAAGGRAREARPLPGRRAAVRAAGRAPRWSAAAPARATSCWWARASAARACCAGWAGPDVARDVLEGLMLDRGLHRCLPARGDAPRPRRAADEPYAADARVDLTRPADLHDRPRRRQGLRRRHLGAPRGRPRAALGPHRRRDRLRAPGRAARARGAAARHERLRARRGRADAARGAVERGLLAAAGRGQARRHGRDGAGRRRGAQRVLPPLAGAQRPRA